MTLKKVISELKESLAEGSVKRRDAQNLVAERVVLPESFTNADRTEVKLHDFILGDTNLTSSYHLGISAFPTLTLDEIQPVLDGMLRMSKNLRPNKGIANVYYEVFWTPEAFQQETRLPAFFSSEITLRSSAHSVNPTKTRIGLQGNNHQFKASMIANRLTITAEGNYRKELGDLIESLNPQGAKLQLSEDDAQRLLRKVNTNPLGKYLTRSLEKALQPEEKPTISVGFGRGVSLGTQKVIEIILRTKHLDYLRETIGKPLINTSGKDKTGVTEFIKIYSHIDLIKGRRLSDLQNLAEAVPKIDLGMSYNQPVITLDQAQELLDTEIDTISKGYKSITGLGRNSHMWRGGFVKRLARDHFGDLVVSQFNESNLREYISFLKSQGYKPIDTFENEPEYIAKERHLLSFFKQSYHKDHGKSIEKFREFYQNTEPNLTIHSITKELDASKTSKIKLPREAKLLSFGLVDEGKAEHHSNNMSISRTTPDANHVHFYCRTSLDSPTLLPIQEYTCKEIGIQFK